MTMNLTCTQVGALLPFYIENKLSANLQQFVLTHLQKCPKCMAKYERLKNLLLNLKNEHTIQTSDDNSKLSDELMLSLSAYVDNELDEIESLKVKKSIISNPKARKEYENLNMLKTVIQRDFEKEKSDIKCDYSNKITKNIFKKTNLADEIYSEESFFRVILILFVCSSSLLFFTFFLLLH